MAFRIKADQPIVDELRRIVRNEFRAALDELKGNGPDEQAILESRKSVKKIRAVLRLVRTDLGEDFGVLNKRLREVSHSLASLRDVDATAETLDALRAHYPTVITTRVATVAGHTLQQRKRRAHGRAARARPRAAAALERTRKSTVRAIERAGRFSVVWAGLTYGYQRARRAMKTLRPDSDATQFHTFRRYVKSHWYHMRLLARVHPTARARTRTLAQLETVLGDDHNLAVLRATILEDPDRFGDARTTALVLGCVVKYQTMLRQRALKLGTRMFKHSASEFRRSAGAWWRSRGKASVAANSARRRRV